jgi:hypothetical protein
MSKTPLTLARELLGSQEDGLEQLRIHEFQDSESAPDDAVTERLYAEFAVECNRVQAELTRTFGEPWRTGIEDDEGVPLKGVFRFAVWVVGGQILFVAASHENRGAPVLLVLGVRQQMDDAQADSVVAEVNAFVARNAWMDFSVWSFQGHDLVVSGTTDESYWSDLRIVFTGVCWACMRFQGWNSDTRQPVLLRVEGAEQRAVNLRFETERWHHLFKFVPENFDQPMWVAARTIRADINRVEFEARQGPWD